MLALLFPGQGVQYTGMGKLLYDTYTGVKEIFDIAGDAAGIDIKKLCFEGSSEELKLTENTQMAVLTVSYAAFRVLTEEYGYVPSCMAGHSLGEITALTAAGAIAFEDAVRLVKLRGRFMQQAAMGSMCAVIGRTADDLRRMCAEITEADSVVEISNYNAPYQTVISGHSNAVQRAKKRFSSEGIYTVDLSVSAPFHCSLMRTAATWFKEALEEFRFYPLRIPVISGVTGAAYVNEDRIKDVLAIQLVSPVEWTKVIRFLRLSGISCFLDAGPGDAMKTLIRSNGHGLKCISLDKEPDVISQSVSGLTNGQSPEKGLEYIRACLGIIASTRNSGKEELRILESCKKLKTMYKDYLDRGQNPGKEELNTAFRITCEILDAKKLPKDEYERLIEEIQL